MVCRGSGVAKIKALPLGATFFYGIRDTTDFVSLIKQYLKLFTVSEGCETIEAAMKVAFYSYKDVVPGFRVRDSSSLTLPTSTIVNPLNKRIQSAALH